MCIKSINILAGTAKENNCPKNIGVEDNIKKDFKAIVLEDVD
jgi:hypothetical protein